MCSVQQGFCSITPKRRDSLTESYATIAEIGGSLVNKGMINAQTWMVWIKLFHSGVVLGRTQEFN